MACEESDFSTPRDFELNLIIDAIDKLMSRRNRPDMPGIARYLRKTRGFTSDKTISLMDKLLSENRLKAVIYKGNISYRNPLRWKNLVNTVAGKQKRSTCDSGSVDAVKRTLHDPHTDGREGVSEGRLQETVISSVDSTVALEQVNHQISNHLKTCSTTINRTKKGNLSQIEVNTKTIMDSSSDSLDFGYTREATPETIIEGPFSDSICNMENSRSSLLETSDNIVSLDESSLNIDESLASEDTSCSTSLVLEPETRKDDAGRDRRRRYRPLLDRPPEVTNKRRRIIRKKTIYDPSEFELTPLIKKNKKRNSNSNAGKEKISASKTQRSSKAAVPVIKPIDPIVQTNLEDESDSNLTESSVLQSSPTSVISNGSKEKSKSRGKGKTANLNNKQCFICSSSINKSAVISCSLCLNVGHKDCIKLESFYFGSSKWRCADCKEYNPVTCSVCDQEPSKSGKMMMCDFCEEFYHMKCVTLPVRPSLLSTVWRCPSCPALDKSDYQKIKTTEVGRDMNVSSTDTKSCSTVKKIKDEIPTESEDIPSVTKPETQAKDQNLDASINWSDVERIKAEIKQEDLNFVLDDKDTPNYARHKPDEPIPSVDDWTAKQVSDYFSEKFGEDVADVFLSQEIDGKCLKSMSRQAVISDLGLQLGIALKVLYYVKKIQLGTNILHHLWA